MQSTEKCVICFKEATHSGGHVHSGNEIIMAKFCEEHYKDRKKKRKGNCIGCYGQWKEEMGIEIPKIGAILIDSEEEETENEI